MASYSLKNTSKQIILLPLTSFFSLQIQDTNKTILAFSVTVNRVELVSFTVNKEVALPHATGGPKVFVITGESAII